MNTASTHQAKGEEARTNAIHIKPPTYMRQNRIDTLFQILGHELTMKDIDTMPRKIRKHLNSLLSHWEHLSRTTS